MFFAEGLLYAVKAVDDPAAGGVGLIDDVAAEAPARRTPDTTVTPQRQNAEAYSSALAEYCRVYDHMSGFWQNR